MLRKVISGGQTGADQGALEGARLAGVATGGYAPKGWLTEIGPQEVALRSYNLEEWYRPGYPPRTRANVEASDGTLIICRPPARGGTKLTVGICESRGRPLYQYAWPPGAEDINLAARAIAQWIFTYEIRILNVAGNRESKNPGIQEATKELVLRVCGAANG